MAIELDVAMVSKQNNVLTPTAPQEAVLPCHVLVAKAGFVAANDKVYRIAIFMLIWYAKIFTL